MYLRKRKRQATVQEPFGDSSGFFVNWAALPDKALLDSELKARIDSALETMPIKYRIPLLLTRIEGMSIKDASRVMGLKENSFKTRLSRAHTLIGKEMARYNNDLPIVEMRTEEQCGRWTGFADDLITETMDKTRRQAFEGHIDDCPSCKSFLHSYAAALSVTKALQCHDLPPELKRKIESFLAARGSPQ